MLSIDFILQVLRFCLSIQVNLSRTQVAFQYLKAKSKLTSLPCPPQPLSWLSPSACTWPEISVKMSMTNCGKTNQILWTCLECMNHNDLRCCAIAWCDYWTIVFSIGMKLPLVHVGLTWVMKHNSKISMLYYFLQDIHSTSCPSLTQPNDFGHLNYSYFPWDYQSCFGLPILMNYTLINA